MRKMIRVDGLCVSTNQQIPLVALLEGPTWDDRNHQIAKRINGSFVCPECGLVIPAVEDVEVWVQGPGGRWYASEWGTGYGFCDECDIAICEGFEHDYVIHLGSKEDNEYSQRTT